MSYLDSMVEYFNEELKSTDMNSEIEKINSISQLLTEEEYSDFSKRLRIDILDMDKFIKKNPTTKVITNPVFYNSDGSPTDDGLLSNAIFGITKDDRQGIYGYIDLENIFLDPSCYKCWYRIDPQVKEIVHKTSKFIIDEHGHFVKDDKGSNGIKWLKAHMSEIKFKKSESLKRDFSIQFLERNRQKMFISKYPVIPPYYRDTNTGKKTVGVSGINKLYSQLIIAVNSLRSTQEYGFDMSGAMEARVQEIILCIYDWACGNTNNYVQVDATMGLGSKGLIRRVGISKTTNYSSRLVISEAELKVNSPKELIVDIDHSAVPMASIMADFVPFVQFYVRRFFEDEFTGTELYRVIDKNGKESYESVKDPMIQFSDDVITAEMNRFITAYNNRFKPVMVELENGKQVYMNFRGRFTPEVDDTILHRPLTWCDIFYMACVEAVRGKHVVITRYPVDSRFNQVFTKIHVSSTYKTEPMYVNNTYYPNYPKIRREDIGIDTDSLFVDTMQVSNLHLPGMGGDYDGE